MNVEVIDILMPTPIDFVDPTKGLAKVVYKLLKNHMDALRELEDSSVAAASRDGFRFAIDALALVAREQETPLVRTGEPINGAALLARFDRGFEGAPSVFRPMFREKQRAAFNDAVSRVAADASTLVENIADPAERAKRISIYTAAVKKFLNYTPS